jgi:hypothetical protein
MGMIAKKIDQILKITLSLLSFHIIFNICSLTILIFYETKLM